MKKNDFEIKPEQVVNFINPKVGDEYKNSTAIIEGDVYTIYDGMQNYIAKFNCKTGEINLNVGDKSNKDLVDMFMSYVDSLKTLINE